MTQRPGRRHGDRHLSGKDPMHVTLVIAGGIILLGLFLLFGELWEAGPAPAAGLFLPTWLAVALVIFATWKSLRAIWGSYLFGVLYWAYNYIPGLSRSTLELFKMLPYVVTILVLLMVSMRKKKEDQPRQKQFFPKAVRLKLVNNSTNCFFRIVRTDMVGQPRILS